MTTDNDDKFTRYAALEARIRARKENPTTTWVDHIDDAPIRITAKNALTTTEGKG